MNQRMRELAIQSGLNAPYGSDHEGLRDFDYKKFAELIVRECLSIADRRGAYEVMDDIIEHFGAES